MVSYIIIDESCLTYPIRYKANAVHIYTRTIQSHITKYFSNFQNRKFTFLSEIQSKSERNVMKDTIKHIQLIPKTIIHKPPASYHEEYTFIFIKKYIANM